MTNLNVGIKSANITNAVQITNYLYELVETEKIASFKINKITKGANSIDISTLIPLLQSVDLNEIYQRGIESGAIHLAEAFIGMKIVKEMISIVKEIIDMSEKVNAKSKIGISCKIGRSVVAKFGRSYGIEPFDTILVSATPESVEKQLLGQNQWGEISIAKEKYFMIRHIAVFVKTPIRAIKWIGKVKSITYNPISKKSIIFLDGSPEEIRPIPYDNKCPHNNAHGVAYTTLARVKAAKTLCDVYPSLDQGE